MNDPLKIIIVDQSAILRELGISGPGAQTQAQKVSNDHVVLDRAMKLLLAEKVPQVLAEMTPTERARLLKRTGPQEQPKITVEWSILRGEVMGQWHIHARGIRSFANQSVVLGEQNFISTPDRVKTWKPFGVTCPHEIVSEYRRVYEPLSIQSNQSNVYARLRAPSPAPDLTKVPGPNYDPNRSPDRARGLVEI